MNLLKENPVLGAIIAAAVVVVGTLGYLLSQSLGEYQIQKENLEARVAELHRLQNSSPYPSKENVEASKKKVEELREAVGALEQQFRAAVPELPSGITPQQFQDELRRVVTAIVEKAQETKVQLPEGFYLGFDEFRTGLPKEIETPFLARQLEVNRWLLLTIIESEVARVDSFVRKPLPVEQDPELANWPEKPAANQIIRTNSVLLTITGDQARVRRAINQILGSPQFLIIRAIEISNSAQEGPAKTDSLASPQPATSAAPTLDSLFGSPSGETKRGEDLPIVLGRESVTATMNLEFLDFAPLNLK